MKTFRLLVIPLVALMPSLGLTDDTLATFRGAIGADGVSGAPGPGPVATSVNRNIVRGVQPPAQLWAIAAFRAEVRVGGHITVDGRGLVFAGGDTIGTALVVTPGGTTTLNILPHLSVKPWLRSSNEIRTRFLSPLTETSGSMTCCRLGRRTPAIHPCC